jgi:hypothetical protein
MDVDTFLGAFGLNRDDQLEILQRLEGSGHAKPPFKIETEPKGKNGNLCDMITFSN